jgi:hypothetical protein
MLKNITEPIRIISKFFVAFVSPSKFNQLDGEFRTNLKENNWEGAVSKLEEIVKNLDPMILDLIKEEKTIADKINVLRKHFNLGFVAHYIIKWLENPEKTIKEIKTIHQKYSFMNTFELNRLETDFNEYLRDYKDSRRAISTMEKIIKGLDDISLELIKEEKTTADKVRVLRQLIDYGLSAASYVIKWLEDPEKTKQEIKTRCQK